MKTYRSVMGLIESVSDDKKFNAQLRLAIVAKCSRCLAVFKPDESVHICGDHIRLCERCQRELRIGKHTNIDDNGRVLYVKKYSRGETKRERSKK